MLNLQKAEFVLSAATLNVCPRDGLPQIVFAGRSNVGKSSVINRLLNRKNFARVGGKPGKTVHLNYFRIDGRLYLVDIPGYGHAEVPAAERQRWAKLVEGYFQTDGLLTLGVQIVDARHKPTRDDVTMADFFRETGKPFVVVANKLDKLKKSEIEPNLAQIRTVLTLPEEIPLIPFSAEKGTGRELLLREILTVSGE